MTEIKTRLIELGEEEAKLVQARLSALIEELGIQMVVSPKIEVDGRLSAQLQILKKVQGIPAGEFLASLENEKGTEEKAD